MRPRGAVQRRPPWPAAQAAPSKKAAEDSKGKAEQSDVEQAVLGHGPNLGPYNEGRGLRLVRDPKFPVRVTVQFYKATSNGVVSEKDLDGIARSIGGVYEHADAVGSWSSRRPPPPTACRRSRKMVPGERVPSV